MCIDIKVPATGFEPQVTKVHVPGVPTTPASEGPYNNVSLLAVVKQHTPADRSGLGAKYQSGHKPGLGTCISESWRNWLLEAPGGPGQLLKRPWGLRVVCVQVHTCVCKSQGMRQLDTRGCRGELLGRLGV